eukprot:Skav234294  [mRNA]  locus=scaffold2271:192868:193491:+ [translate_table: standard]
MADKAVPSTVCFCTVEDIQQRLPREGPQSLYPRRRKSNEYCGMIEKMATAVEASPWGMHRAARELRLWVREKHQKPPLLDISFIQSCLARGRPLFEVDPQTYWFDTQAGQRAVGLEPVMNDILINRPRHAPAADTSLVPSARAEFVYSVAAELHSQHHYSWDAGIDVGERCFQRLAKQQRVALSKDDAHAAEADEMPLLDVADRQNL